MKFGVIATIAALLLVIVYLLTLNGQTNTDDSISVEQAMEKARVDSTILFLDVRTEPEFTGELGHLPGAKLVPLAELEGRLAELEPYRENQMIVVCRSGNRSGKATKILRDKGFHALNMVGGMQAWNKMMELLKVDSSGVKNETMVK